MFRFYNNASPGTEVGYSKARPESVLASIISLGSKLSEMFRFFNNASHSTWDLGFLFLILILILFFYVFYYYSSYLIFLSLMNSLPLNKFIVSE